MTPTTAPTAAPTLAPTASPTVTPTAAPTTTPTAAPTEVPTLAPTGNPGDTLDLTADPNYGLIEIDSGFIPDPRTQEVASGGIVDVSYLGGGCTGWASSAPDFSVRYTIIGFSSLLRFYFEGSGDATLVINDPQGNWSCNDDSEFGGVNPLIDFSNPADGRYDIWVGSFSPGTTILGTLNVTEVDSNHP